jgi:hypothetical protein
LQAQIVQMRRWGGGMQPAAAHHFMAFDGCLYSRLDPALSGCPHQSNVASLYDQACSAQGRTPGFYADYFAGLGTLEAAAQPAVQGDGHEDVGGSRGVALLAYQRLAERVASYSHRSTLERAGSVSVSVVALGRGQASALAFVHLLAERGIVSADGRQHVPPGVPVCGVVFLAPLATLLESTQSLPANMPGPVLVVRSNRPPVTPFAVCNYADDPRVLAIEMGLHHVGMVGGGDLRGGGAAVLEGATGYLQRCGIPLCDVPLHRQFMAAQVTGHCLTRPWPERVAANRSGPGVPTNARS